jgi:hypothetical protein
MVKKKNIFRWILILVMLLYLSGCSECDIFSEGKKKVKVYSNLDPYERILIRGIYNVTLKQGEQQKVIFSGTQNQLNNTTVSHKQEWLKIETPDYNQRKSDYKKPEVTILVDSLKELWSYYPIQLTTMDTIRSKKLKIYLVGEVSECDITVHSDYFRLVNSSISTGKYKVKGKTEEFHCRLRGSAHLEARKLKADYVGFKQESIGNGYIYVNKRLKLESYSRGDLYYKGSPDKITKDLYSSGRLIPIE